MRKRIGSLIMVLILCVYCFTGCSKEKEDSQVAADTSSVTEESTTKETVSEDTKPEQQADTTEVGETYIFTDSCGRKVELPKKIDRIAPSGALAQIVLFAIAPDKFVGLSSNWADEAVQYLDSEYLELPVFGQFYGSADLNMEALAAADPQVIIDIGEAKDTVVEDMDSIQEQLGIPTIFIEATTEGMGDCYQTLGKLLGEEDKGKELEEYCNSTYQTTIDMVNKIGEENKVSLVYCVGDTGTNVIAKGSFHAEVLDILVNNVAVVKDPSSKGTGNEISLEQLYEWNPEVILFDSGSIYGSVKDDTAWNGLDAISKGNYYEVPYGPYNWMGFPPSVNRYLGMVWLSNLLYPEKFNYNLEEKVKEYYNLFYHCELTSEQYEELVKNSVSK
ncbi:MAG TPA: ABC transporter substrate-binding protein [Lachnospiraceae bacterium]|nr:ABC transporter substrate-binding protein [Lachnospiraceae bacterium]